MSLTVRDQRDPWHADLANYLLVASSSLTDSVYAAGSR
jgi:hypothetical protein